MKTILSLIGVLCVACSTVMVAAIAYQETRRQWRRRHLATALSRLESEWEPVLDERRPPARSWRTN